MGSELTKVDDLIINIKQSGGKHQLPFTWEIRDIDKTFFRLSEDAFVDRDLCEKDARLYIQKYLNH